MLSDVWSILDILDVLCEVQRLCNTTLQRARLEPWMANAPMCPAKAAGGRFCRFERLRQFITTYIRTFRMSYVRNPTLSVDYLCRNLPVTTYNLLHIWCIPQIKRGAQPFGQCILVAVVAPGQVLKCHASYRAHHNLFLILSAFGLTIYYVT